jgi:hypothetical protein
MICTSASATAPPLTSTTVPLMAPVAPPCGKAAGAGNKLSAKKDNIKPRMIPFMTYPLQENETYASSANTLFVAHFSARLFVDTP